MEVIYLADNMTFGVNIIPKDNTVSLGNSENKWAINGVSDPKLTDTTYDTATQSTAGLMSATDKIRLDNLSSTPFIVTIPTGQWSGSENDYYISVNASNITINSILIPNYDKDSAAFLNGSIWCVPANGSFTIHTSAIPSGTVTILVQFYGVVGEANY